MDIIKLTLPAKPEYVSTARLTTSAIANRLNFSIDDIEDMKVAVSEAIIYLLNQFVSFKKIAIEYKVNGDLDICVFVKVENKEGLLLKKDKASTNELGLYIIESMSDKLEKVETDGIIYGFKICKARGGRV